VRHNTDTKEPYVFYGALRFHILVIGKRIRDEIFAFSLDGQTNQSKRTEFEFVCPSSTRPLSLARNCVRRPDRSVKMKKNRLAVVNPFAVAGSQR
jgi:hypothetical protein